MPKLLLQKLILKVPISQPEVEIKQRELEKLHREVNLQTEEFVAATNRFHQRVRDLRARETVLVKEIVSREEERISEVFEQKDYADGVIRYLNPATGAQVSERPMTLAERQTNIGELDDSEA